MCVFIFNILSQIPPDPVILKLLTLSLKRKEEMIPNNLEQEEMIASGVMKMAKCSSRNPCRTVALHAEKGFSL